MRKIRNKYKRPKVTWNLALIESEKEIKLKYGLRRKKEIWSAQSILRSFRQRARQLNAVKDEPNEKILIDKTIKLGLLCKGQQLDDILSLQLSNILDRRLQTIVHSKGFAPTVKLARQMITHGHIAIEGRKTTFPSYLVPIEEESRVGFYSKSPFNNKKPWEVKQQKPEVKEIKPVEAPIKETVEMTEGQEPPVEEAAS